MELGKMLSDMSTTNPNITTLISMVSTKKDNKKTFLNSFENAYIACLKRGLHMDCLFSPRPEWLLPCPAASELPAAASGAARADRARHDGGPPEPPAGRVAVARGAELRGLRDHHGHRHPGRAHPLPAGHLSLPRGEGRRPGGRDAGAG